MEDLQDYDASTIRTPVKNKSRYIGSGGFATALYCRLPTGEEVAIKCFSSSTQRNEKRQNPNKHIKEAMALRKIAHPNIVKLFGVTEWKEYFGIIMEYVVCGNLDSFLQHQNLKKIEWPLLLRIALNICEGIQKLHCYKPKKCLVHGDIKTVNILLDMDLTAKLADFGSVNMVLLPGASKPSTDYPQTREHTALFTAPEFLNDCNIERTAAMDIYSFGMVLYEITTRTRIFEGAQVNPAIVLQVIIDRGQRPDKRLYQKIGKNLSEADQEIFTLLTETMKLCWKQNSNERPTAAKISDDLRALYEQFDPSLIKKMASEVVDKMNLKKSIPEASWIPLRSVSSLDPEVSPSSIFELLEKPTTAQQTTSTASSSHHQTTSDVSISQRLISPVCLKELWDTVVILLALLAECWKKLQTSYQTILLVSLSSQKPNHIDFALPEQQSSQEFFQKSVSAPAEPGKPDTKFAQSSEQRDSTDVTLPNQLSLHDASEECCRSPVLPGKPCANNSVSSSQQEDSSSVSIINQQSSQDSSEGVSESSSAPASPGQPITNSISSSQQQDSAYGSTTNLQTSHASSEEQTSSFTRTEEERDHPYLWMPSNQSDISDYLSSQQLFNGVGGTKVFLSTFFSSFSTIAASPWQQRTCSETFSLHMDFTDGFFLFQQFSLHSPKESSVIPASPRQHDDNSAPSMQQPERPEGSLPNQQSSNASTEESSSSPQQSLNNPDSSSQQRDSTDGSLPNQQPSHTTSEEQKRFFHGLLKTFKNLFNQIRSNKSDTPDVSVSSQPSTTATTIALNVDLLVNADPGRTKPPRGCGFPRSSNVLYPEDRRVIAGILNVLPV